MAKQLTTLAVQKARPGQKRYAISDGHSLNLIVQPSGHKSWAYHYKFRGAPRKLTIGPYPAIDLKQARALAQKARAEVATGCDPAADKQAARRAPKPDHDTIEARVAAYLTHAKARTRESTWAEISRILQRELIPAWQGRGLSSIGKSDVRALLASIMERGSPVMANRIRTAASGLFSWAVEQDMIQVSPCERVKAPAVEVARDRV
ncbi:MAG: Arm DNA-binding domain-containing protein, partial [Methylocella sp.]